jgi:hypothetical protein
VHIMHCSATSTWCRRVSTRQLLSMSHPYLSWSTTCARLYTHGFYMRIPHTCMSGDWYNFFLKFKITRTHPPRRIACARVHRTNWHRLCTAMFVALLALYRNTVHTACVASEQVLLTNAKSCWLILYNDLIGFEGR